MNSAPEEVVAESVGKRRRIPVVASVLALLNPLVGMLYVGRPLRGALYFGLFVLVLGGAFLLARGGLWPDGLPWLPIVLLVNGIFMIDGYRIARRYKSGFTGGWYTTWYGLVAVAVAFVGFTLSFRAFVFEPFRQPSGSMLPTLVYGDQFWVSKGAYRDAPPQRGDIVVFLVPGTNVHYVKRVVGLPDDVVDYDGIERRLTINGTAASLEILGVYEADPQYRLGRERLDGKEHQVLHMLRSTSAGGVFRVPQGHYFMLGDNRDNSQDSRFTSIGFIPAENIVGKVGLVWWNTDEPKRAGIVPE